MIIAETVGKMDMAIGRFEGPVMAYMEKSETDFAKKSLKNELYNVKKSKHYSESVGSLNGLPDWVAGDGDVPFSDFEEGYSKTFIHTVFQQGVSIKRTLIDDASLINMQNQGGRLTDTYNRTMEKFVHAPFNFCNQATFDLAGGTFSNVGADGQPLASIAHPSKTGKATNQSNLSTYTFNAANLKLAEEMMNDLTDDIGEKANICPDTIIVPYQLRNEAWELVGSEGKLGTNNNDINSFYGKYNVIVSRWLNDPNDWFLADMDYMKKTFFWLDRIPLEVRSQKNFRNQNWEIAGYARSSLGFTDWRAILCNKAA